ncbi:nucleotidyltransferase [Sarcina sp. JB2]|uniref:Nucleotidyltransferase n=1 Tax=Candidatus Sarcina troglodytae TaxID=2726954 RepID=A0ACD1BE99_9CLOT|nr:nucleotidyltransferase [Sarcina sp. JB2]QPJ85668.1 nucleotidyltransferase [Sarcina sp. JB2]
MKITGLITEYNPFHLGHEFHINSSKQKTNCDYTICIMSGNFVQRGIPAIVDKWSRTKMALLGGVDLVLELPTIYSVSSAEYFAFGAISTLNSLNIVDNICFGSECGDVTTLKKIAEILVNEPLEFKKDLKEQLNLGLSFPKARSIAIEKYIKNSNIDNIEHILNSSNNILAIEYCKSLFKLKSNINPITITRQGSGYNDNNLNQYNFSSASSIRKAITEKSLKSCINVIPKYTYEILENSKISDLDRMFFYVKYKLLSNPQFLSNIPDANEGLGNKILNNIGNFNNFDEFIMSCKSKRYSYTRISRVLCQCFLSLSKEDILLSKSKPQYIRVLGLNKNGAKILKEIKKNSKIKIVNKISSKNTDPMLSIDIKATNLYSLLNNNIMHNADFKISPIILK